MPPIVTRASGPRRCRDLETGERPECGSPRAGPDYTRPGTRDKTLDTIDIATVRPIEPAAPPGRAGTNASFMTSRPRAGDPLGRMTPAVIRFAVASPRVARQNGGRSPWSTQASEPRRRRGPEHLPQGGGGRMPELIPCQRHLFDLPDDVAYLNCAYMSPLLKRAAEVGAEAIARKLPALADPARRTSSPRASGRGRCSPGCSAPRADDVAMVPAASYGLAIAAANLPVAPGPRILVLAEQFPSNVYTWRALAAQSGAEVVTVARPARTATGPARCLPAWTSGWRSPPCRTAIGSTAACSISPRSARAAARWAARWWSTRPSRSAPCPSISPRSARTSWSAPATSGCSGRTAWAISTSPRSTQHGRPLEQNWIARRGSEDFARLIDYQDAYQPGARRFDVGERSNFALRPGRHRGAGAAAGVGRGPDRRDARSEDGGDRRARRRARPAAQRRRTFAPAIIWACASHRARHDGCPNAWPSEQVYVSLRGDSLRVTPHLYNHEQDLDRLFEVLQAVL